MRPFQEQVEAHGTSVWRVCRALSASNADADDLWSATFLAALRAYPRLASDSDVRAWLVAIARNKAIDAARARSRRPTTPLTQAAEPSVCDRPLDGEVLRIAVSRLAPRQRAAVAYRHLADLSYAQIAASLDCTEAAARRAVADGLANLRKRHTEEELS